MLSTLSLARGMPVVLKATNPEILKGTLAPIVQTASIPHIVSGFPAHVDENFGRIENLLTQVEDLRSRDSYRDTLYLLKRFYYKVMTAPNDTIVSKPLQQTYTPKQYCLY